MKRTVATAVATAMLVLSAQNGAYGIPKPSPTPTPEPTTHRYQLVVGGSTKTHTIWYTVPVGKGSLTVDESRPKRLPWAKSTKADHLGEVNLYVRNDRVVGTEQVSDGGSIMCQILVDGEVVSYARSAGGASSAVECSYSPAH